MKAGTPPDDPRSRKAGRRPKLSREQQAAIVDAVRSGQRTAAQMARHYKISEPTVSRLLAASRATGEVPVTKNPGGERIVGVLPVAALDERLAVVGTSGSGKTYATKGLVERLMQAGARVCVVDPLGVWWGLSLAADGTTAAGSPVVVFGGRMPTCRSRPAWARPSAGWSERSHWPVWWTCRTLAPRRRGGPS
jgi:hypothetical protein